MTAAVAGRAAAGAVRSGPVTAAEKATLERKLAAAQAAQGGGAPTAQKATPARPAAPPPPNPARPANSRPAPANPAPGPTAGRRPLLGGRGGVVNEGAGFVLALLVWSWIALPLFRGGPDEVRNVLRAKFLNKAPDGSWLP